MRVGPVAVRPSVTKSGQRLLGPRIAWGRGAYPLESEPVPAVDRPRRGGGEGHPSPDIALPVADVEREHLGSFALSQEVAPLDAREVLAAQRASPITRTIATSRQPMGSSRASAASASRTTWRYWVRESAFGRSRFCTSTQRQLGRQGELHLMRVDELALREKRGRVLRRGTVLGHGLRRESAGLERRLVFRERLERQASGPAPGPSQRTKRLQARL